MKTIRKLGLYGAGLLAAFALGWFLRHPQVSIPSPAIKTSPQTIAARALAELLGYYQRQDMQLTARNRSLVDSLKYYTRHSHEQLLQQQQAETVFVHRDTGITPDSVTRLCYAVVRLCEIRADSAIAQRDRYAEALRRQLSLAPQRWSVTVSAVPGPGYAWWPKSRRGFVVASNVTLSFRIFP